MVFLTDSHSPFSLLSTHSTGLPPYQFGPIGIPLDQRTHEGRYVWGPGSNGNSACGPSNPSPAHVQAAQAAQAAMAAASLGAASQTGGAFSRMSPYEGLYSGLHSSPSALSALRNFSPGELILSFSIFISSPSCMLSISF